MGVVARARVLSLRANAAKERAQRAGVGRLRASSWGVRGSGVGLKERYVGGGGCWGRVVLRLGTAACSRAARTLKAAAAPSPQPRTGEGKFR